MPALTWKPLQGHDGFEAFSGQLRVGFVLRRSVDGQIIYDANDAVRMKWIAKGHGEVGSFDAGKRAVSRAWARWLDEAGLTPA